MAMISILTLGCAASGTGQGQASVGGLTATRATTTTAPGGADGKSGPRAPGRPFKVVNSDGSVSYTGVGARVWPAKPGERPSVTRAEVLRALGVAGVAPQGLRGAKPTFVRLVEYENQFGVASTAGSVTPEVPRQLAWFAEYDNVRQVISVPPGLSRTRPHGGLTSNWVDVVVLSARTGAVIDAFDYSG
jgi:hypothetical protein